MWRAGRGGKASRPLRESRGVRRRFRRTFPVSPTNGPSRRPEPVLDASISGGGRSPRTASVTLAVALGRRNIGHWHLALPQLGDNNCPTRIHTRTRRRFSRRLGLFPSRAVRCVPACLGFLRRPLLQAQEITVRHRGSPPNFALQPTAGMHRLPVPLVAALAAAAELKR